MTLVVFCFFATANCWGDSDGLLSRGASLAGASRLCFLILDASDFSVGGALSPDRRADRLLLGSGSSAGGSGAGVFLRRVSLGAATSGRSDWFAPRLRDVLALENMKPSRSSSYTARDQHHSVQSSHRRTWVLSARQRAVHVILRGIDLGPFLCREPHILVKVDSRNGLSLLALCLRHAQGLERRTQGD
jgi:hypothetical protein